MLRRVIAFCLGQRVLVLAFVALLIGVGVWSAVRLPIDAVPDVTNVQVQVNTVASALSPLEVERQITFPIEVAMSGLPDVEDVRSLSLFGLSQVTVVFRDGTDIYFARQQVGSRLQQAKDAIPPGLGVPEMGPVSTGLGEVFQYALKSDSLDLTELRTIQDWLVKPQLLTVPGVAEVNSWGGFEKQFQVLVRPEALARHGLSLHDVVGAVAANNANQGGGYVAKAGEQVVVRGVGRLKTLEDIRGVVVTAPEGVPVRVSDVADVEVGSAIRQGAVTKDGKGEAATGLVLMLMGSNSRVVVNDVKSRVDLISKSLPPEVRIEPFYDRTDLVRRTLDTVEHNLVEGAAFVVAVLFLLLGHVRAALIVALAIPLSMLFAVGLMVKAGITGSLMSLGAIDFGLVVDGSVVMIENCVRRLNGRKEGESHAQVVLDSCAQVARPILFGVGIIIVVYLPVLTLEGIEGKLFRPMATTVVFALVGSLLLTFALTPVLASILLRGRAKHREGRVLRAVKAGYVRVLGVALARRGVVLAAAFLAVAVAAGLAARLGSEFVPKLDEGALALEIRRPAGTSVEEANRLNGLLEHMLLERFPDEVTTAFARMGRAEIATDAQGPDSTDFMILLRPREGWRRATTRDELIGKMDAEFSKFLGMTYEFSQPIELRMNELIAGVRSDVAIKLFGDDMGVLAAKAEEVVAAVSQIPGAKGFRYRQVAGLPTLQIVALPERLSRHGLKTSDVMELVQAMGGIEASQILDGPRRFDLVVKLPDRILGDRRALESLPVRAPGGEQVPLGALCRIEEVAGPAEIDHENGARVLVVEGNVRGRDIGSFVADARTLFDDRKIALPAGYRVEFGGQFENLERASARLSIVVPGALLLIFFLLFTTFGSVREALLVFTGVPLAAVGGIVALSLRGMPFSISAGVGFIALFGVAVLNGLVMVSQVIELRRRGLSVLDAIREGASVRLRPVLMTALVASLGFLPMAASTGAGAEVQRPLATVVIGGLVSSTVLTLIVLPVLYQLFARERAEVPA